MNKTCIHQPLPPVTALELPLPPPLQRLPLLLLLPFSLWNIPVIYYFPSHLTTAPDIIVLVLFTPFCSLLWPNYNLSWFYLGSKFSAKPIKKVWIRFLEIFIALFMFWITYEILDSATTQKRVIAQGKPKLKIRSFPVALLYLKLIQVIFKLHIELKPYFYIVFKFSRYNSFLTRK